MGKLTVKGLDNWLTHCRIENPGIDPLIILEATNGGLFVQLGNFNMWQARELANMILDTCDEAQEVEGFHRVDPSQE